MTFTKLFHAPRFLAVVIVAFGLCAASVGCSSSKPSGGSDSATAARNLADSMTKVEQARAAELRDGARTALASLLKDPKSAVFDSVKVVQPPPADGRPSPMVVCGRIRGKPGIGGRSGPAAFVYQNRMTVFIEDATNEAAFGQVWSETCGHGRARVVTR